MEQGNKILIWAVLILLMAIVSFNFTGMTGEYLKGSITAITLDRTSVLPGEIITLTVVPGSMGVVTDIDVYRADNDYRYMDNTAQICRTTKCKDAGTVEFRIIDSFEPGSYYFRVYDLAKKDYVKAYFTVEVKYAPEPPQEHR